MRNHHSTNRRISEPISEKKILKDIEEEQKIKKIQVIHGYIHHKRLIPQHIYCKLKALRICQNCGKEIHYPPEIHHIIAKRYHGSNRDENNLIALCKECHKFYDSISEVKE